jgi:hypothetical protein
MKTTNGKRGGNLVGKPHNDKSGNPVGGIKAEVTDAGGKPVELEGGEVIINKEASKKHWKELSRINQSAGNGVPINAPIDPHDEDPSEYKEGGKVIEFNRNHIPNRWILNYAKSIKKDHPEIWKLGGNIYGNTAFENLCRVSARGYWLDTEEWMYIKWRSFVARHRHDFRIQGVVAMLKWVDKVDKGWKYMKDLIEDNIAKKKKMGFGGSLNKRTMQKKVDDIMMDNIFKSRKEVTNTAERNRRTKEYVKDDVKLAQGGDVITYKMKFNKKYGFESNESHSLAEISKLTKLKLSALQDIYDKGIGAYKTNPSSVRPNVKSKEQWAMARVYSAVMGGKAAKVDSNELERGKKYKDGGVAGDIYSLKDREQFTQIMTIYNDLTDKFAVKNYFIDNKNNSVIFILDGRVNEIKKNAIVNYFKKKSFDIINTNNIEWGADKTSDYFKVKVKGILKYADGGNVKKNYNIPSTEELVQMVMDEKNKAIRNNLKLGIGIVVGRYDGYSATIDYGKKDNLPLILSKRPSRGKVIDIIENNPEVTEIYFIGTLKSADRVGEEMEIIDDFAVLLWKKPIDENKALGVSFQYTDKRQDPKNPNNEILADESIYIIVDKKDAPQYDNKRDDGEYLYAIGYNKKDGSKTQNRIKKSTFKNLENDGDILIIDVDKSDREQILKPIETYANGGSIGFEDKLFDELAAHNAPSFAEGGLIAPNGKKSNLTPEQYKLVRTPEFKTWFGDWEKVHNLKMKDPAMDEITLQNLSKDVSKVVDENGEPLVVYHSYIAKVNKFKPFNVFKTKCTYEIGSHFGDLNQADTNITFKIRDKGLGVDKNGNPNFQSKTYECFLNIKKIKRVKDRRHWLPTTILKDLYPNKNVNWFAFEKGKENIDLFLKEVNGKVDGLVYKNEFEGVGDSFLVFYPNQIKLADGSNTTFDASNPDIRYEDGGEVKLNTYKQRVNSNLESMGTPASEWSAVPISGFANTDADGKIVTMPQFSFPQGYAKAPTLFPNIQGGNMNCELCGRTPIKNAFYIQNDKKKFTMLVGSECVTHFGEGASGKQNLRQFKLNQAEILNNDFRKAYNYIKENYSKEKTERLWNGGIRRYTDWQRTFLTEDYDKFYKSKVSELAKEGNFNIFFNKKSRTNDSIYWGDVVKNIKFFDIAFYEKYRSDEKDAQFLSWYKRNKESGEEMLKALSLILKSTNGVTLEFDSLQNVEEFKYGGDIQYKDGGEVGYVGNEYLEKKYGHLKKKNAKFEDLPEIYIRIGLPKKVGNKYLPSRNHYLGGLEAGVSVFTARYSPNSNFIFVDLESESERGFLSGTYASFQEDIKNGSNDIMYLLEGSPLLHGGGGYQLGSDKERLLNTKGLKVIGQLNPNKIIPYEEETLSKDGKPMKYLYDETLSGEELKSYPKFKDGGIVNSDMVLYHGGNLDDYDDVIAQKNGRYEYGAGLYLTTHQDTARKYAKGSRKLYKITLSEGVDINDAYLKSEDIYAFISKYVLASKKAEVKSRIAKYITDGKAKAFLFNNIILNEKAIAPSKTMFLRQFYVDNGIDYDVVDNPFGWGETMVVLYNMDKLKSVEQVGKNSYKQGGEIGENVKCKSCSWEWNTSDSEDFDKYVCHECGTNNSNKMANGGAITTNDFDRTTFQLSTPTGERSRLTYLQQVLVRTKAFKDFFGDWETAAKRFISDNRRNFENHYNRVSKVLDMVTLEPRLVYHGTRVENEFYQFDVSRQEGVGRPYAYFAHNIEYSEQFTQFSQRNQSQSSPFMYNVFLYIDKPFMARGTYYEFLRKDGDYWYSQILSTIILDKYGVIDDRSIDIAKAVKVQIYDYIERIIGIRDSPFWVLMANDGDSVFKNFLISYGYDGVFYGEEISLSYDANNPAQYTEAETIFFPNNIKLGDGRNLNFDSKNSDIRLEKGGNLPTINTNTTDKEELSSILFGNKYENGGVVKELEEFELEIPNLNVDNKQLVEDLIKKMKL